MKLFTCQHCGQLLYFENTSCERCGQALGFLPESGRPRAHWSSTATLGAPLAAPGAALPALRQRRPRRLQLAGAGQADDADYCVACRHNRTVPDLSVAGESRALAQAARSPSTGCSTRCSSLGLPHPTKSEDEAAWARLRFPGRSAGRRSGAQGDDRPRQRPDHDRAGRGRRRRARAATDRAGRALPDPAGPPAPRGRPLLLGPAGRRHAARSTASARCSATSGKTMARR